MQIIHNLVFELERGFEREESKIDFSQNDMININVKIKGEPAEQANEMLEHGIFGSKEEIVRQGIRELYKKWKNK